MKNIAIIGSRDLACTILKWVSNQNSINVIGVIAPPFSCWWNDNLRQVAVSLDIKVFDDLNKLIEEKPDIIFSINYWKIIGEDLIDKVQGGIINIHHSYLLKYRGRYSTSWAIMNARRLNCWIHGTTLHFIDKNLDAGPIIASYKCEITDFDTAETLFYKVESLAFEMFKDNFFNILINKIFNFITPDSDYHYYDTNSKNNIVIDENNSSLDLEDFKRAWTFKNRKLPIINSKI